MLDLGSTFALKAPVVATDHAIGPDDARITVVEYGDFECPNCKQAAPAVKLLLGRFAGRVRFVYRHFPLEEVHPHSLAAAEAAASAGAQGKFWPMHDLLFVQQARLEREYLFSYADRIRLDMARFTADMDEHRCLQRVRDDQQSGRASGVRSTPTFFVNRERHDVSFGLLSLFESVEALTQSPGSSKNSVRE